MNRIYKVIWNKARGCYVVASEFAKNHTKSCQGAKTVAAALVLALAAGFNGAVLAEDTQNSDEETEDPATVIVGAGPGLAIGVGSVTEFGTDTALGNYAFASGKFSEGTDVGEDSAEGSATAIGANSTAAYTDSTAVGAGSKAQGMEATAIGAWSLAATNSSTAVGESARATGSEATAVGQNSLASGSFASALGEGSMAAGDFSIALGHAALAGSVDEDGNIIGDADAAIAIGMLSQASADSSLAEGHMAQALAEGSIAVGKDASVKENADKSIAIGYIATVSQDSEDAVALGAFTTASADYTVSIGHFSKATALSAVSIGDYASAAGKYAVALGYRASAAGLESLAFGKNSLAAEPGAVAMGTYAETKGNKAVAIGYGSQAYTNGSVALGRNTVAGADGTSATVAVAIGSDAKATALEAAALGYRAEASAFSSMAFGNSANASGENATALGTSAGASGVNAIAIGYKAQAPNSGSVALGSFSETADAEGTSEFTLTKVTDLDDGSEQKVSVTFGNFAGAVPYGTVSVGATGKERTITNVAAGRISETSTDAINGSQLYAVAKEAVRHTGVTVNGGTMAPGDLAGEAADESYTEDGNLMLNVKKIDAGSVYDIKLNKDLDLGEDGSVTIGDTVITNNNITLGDENNSTVITNNSVTSNTFYAGDNTYINNSGLTIQKGDTTYGDIVINQGDVSFGGNKIVNVSTATGGDKTEVVNVEYLENYVGDTIMQNDIHVDTSKEYNVQNNTVSVDMVNSTEQLVINDVASASDVGDINNFNDSVLNEDGSKTTVVDAINNIDNRVTNIDNRVTNLETQIEDVTAEAGKHTLVTVNEGVAAPEDGSYTDGNLQLAVKNEDGQKTFDVKLNNNLDLGQNGSVTIGDTFIDSSSVTTTDVHAENKITVGDNTIIEDNRISMGDTTITDSSVTVGDTVIEDNRISMGDTTITNSSVTIGDTVIEDNRISMGDTTITNSSVTIGDTVIDSSSVTTTDVHADNRITVGDNTVIEDNRISMGDTTITNSSVTVGDTVINNDGLSINNGPVITKNNVDMNNQQIHNVAAGTEDTDAVNVSQLKDIDNKVEQNSTNINNLSGSVNKLGKRINKVGAGAAALAALHPLDFDPDDKISFSAGYGHYRGENAAAVGAFYQPNDDTLFSVGATVGNGEDMINAGLSIRFGQSSHQSRSKKAMAKEIIELRSEVAELKAMVYGLAGPALDPFKTQLFPDTPENHWAYDYVAVVAGNGILEGYPDGMFDGSRPMTRYEMAAVIYRLMSKGVEVDRRMLQEFAPELARVKVDSITHYGDGTPHIQRVRVIPGRG